MKNILLINELKSRLPSNLYTELVMSKGLGELDDAQSSQLVADASYVKKPTLVWVFALLFGCFGGHRFYANSPVIGIVFIVLTFLVFAAAVPRPDSGIDNLFTLIWLAAIIDGVLLSKKIAAKNYEKVAHILEKNAR